VKLEELEAGRAGEREMKVSVQREAATEGDANKTWVHLFAGVWPSDALKASKSFILERSPTTYAMRFTVRPEEADECWAVLCFRDVIGRYGLRIMGRNSCCRVSLS